MNTIFGQVDPAAFVLAVSAIIVSLESQSDRVDSTLDDYFAMAYTRLCSQFDFGGMGVKEGMYCTTCGNRMSSKQYSRAAAVAGKALVQQIKWPYILTVRGKEYNSFCFANYSPRYLYIAWLSLAPTVSLKLVLIPFLLTMYICSFWITWIYYKLDSWVFHEKFYYNIDEDVQRLPDAIIIAALAQIIDRTRESHTHIEASGLLIGMAACLGGRGLTGQLTKVAVATRVLPTFADLASDAINSEIITGATPWQFRKFSLLIEEVDKAREFQIVFHGQNYRLYSHGYPGYCNQLCSLTLDGFESASTFCTTEGYLCQLPAKALVAQLFAKLAISYGSIHDLEHAIHFTYICNAPEEFLAQAAFILSSRSSRFNIDDLPIYFPRLDELRSHLLSTPYADKFWCRCDELCHCRYLPCIYTTIVGAKRFQPVCKDHDIWVIIIGTDAIHLQPKLNFYAPDLQFSDIKTCVSKYATLEPKMLIASVSDYKAFRNYLKGHSVL